MTKLCHCGQPLHYVDPEVQRQVEHLVEVAGECIKITVGDATWLVPRHYIALHGIAADKVATLGFERVD